MDRSLNTEPSKPNNAKKTKYFSKEFWFFHVVFWSLTTVIMFLSGLSQFYAFEVALVRNVLYGSLGFCASLALVIVYDKFKLMTTQQILVVCIASSYLVGSSITLLINPITAAQMDHVLWESPIPRWFAGSLNFALVTLVWSSFYLAFKQGLRFVGGDEEQKTAQAISSIASTTNYPEFIALERNKKIVLMPTESIVQIQGAGDYVEITTDEGQFLKRDSLTVMTEQLDPKIFQRVHRSTIVNLHAIKELEPKGKGDYTLTLKSGGQIAASRNYMKDFKAKF